MRIFLDDVRPTPEGWVRAHSVNEAIRLVEYNPYFEGCSLDHDLGDFEWDGGDGYRFVLWMAETGNWPVNKPQVHSMNPVGRARMIADIERYFPSR